LDKNRRDEARFAKRRDCDIIPCVSRNSVSQPKEAHRMDSFYLKILLSFIVGGVWITLASTSAERFGSKVGSVLAGLPSTVVVSLFFITWAQGPETAQSATTVIPVALSINCFLAIAYSIVAPRRGPFLGLGAGWLVWFVGQNLLITLHVAHWAISAIMALVNVAIAYCVFEFVLRVRSHAKVSLRYTAWQIVWRALFSGAIVAFSVIMSRVAGPVWGGIFASFPAVFSSTLIITSTSVSVGFSLSVVKSLIVSGVINPSVYAIVFRFLVLDVGLVWATTIAYAVSVGTSFLTYLFIKRNQK